ncbi:hypothetical protein [Candidatus Parabeggiatoa sp. HSG14]|uniref:hypothetical protein n=1 Tax=Candidatus Parabeggiatoa sp. HSG14 TaxID=3055593 RepID=UPI0025A8617D|nr:hypothetical protein [Thiotrichales bacterium HSG14]
MKTKMLSALISTTLVMSLGSVQATVEETVAITPATTNTQLEVMWQEGQEMPGILSEMTDVEILPMSSYEMGETIGQRCPRSRGCCKRSSKSRGR